MSVEVLNVELEQRRQELQREQEENDRARRIRAELLQPEPPPVRVIYPLKDPERSAFDDAADRVARWWNGRLRRGDVTTAEIQALVRNLRGMGRGGSRSTKP